jgi:hypothetical protein
MKMMMDIDGSCKIPAIIDSSKETRVSFVPTGPLNPW